MDNVTLGAAIAYFLRKGGGTTVVVDGEINCTDDGEGNITIEITTDGGDE